jgi:hypothetical protein
MKIAIGSRKIGDWSVVNVEYARDRFDFTKIMRTGTNRSDR